MYVYGVDGTNTINSILVPRFKNQITRVDFLCVCACNVWNNNDNGKEGWHMVHKVRKNIKNIELDYGSIGTNVKTICNYSCVTLFPSYFFFFLFFLHIVIVIPYMWRRRCEPLFAPCTNMSSHKNNISTSKY